jgi:HEAT repeat protein
MDDQRTNEELFQATLHEESEDGPAWDAVRALRLRGTEEVFQLAVRYCQSVVPLERARGLDVLAQFGARAGKPPTERPHFHERLAIAMEHLRDESARVVGSAAWALAHIGGDTAISALIEMRVYSDPNVRWAVANGMHGSEREDAIATLIELMDDPDDNVRDWATFGLGTQCDEDSPLIREALRKRIEDSYENARREAVWGLARRKDEQGLQILIDWLSTDPWPGDEMAARDVLGLMSDAPRGRTPRGPAKALARLLSAIVHVPDLALLAVSNVQRTVRGFSDSIGPRDCVVGIHEGRLPGKTAREYLEVA